MGQRVLIIEDDQPLAGMLAEYLAGFDIELNQAHTVADGWRQCDGGGFDAVILDVMLPDGDGFELCRRLRAVSDVPILMLTARGDDTDRIVGLELGADDYLPKPFNPRELLARLRAVTRRHRPQPATAASLRFGRLLIDTEARRVWLDERECSLTAYQFDLLMVLASAPGRVLSRDFIMDRLKGHEVEAFDRSIDVHISRIRAQIETDPRRPLRIITVRGAGYVFARDPDRVEPA